MSASQTTQPECWCVYGTRGGGSADYGLEVMTPGCPTHDPANTPAPADRAPCEVCQDDEQECGCYGEDEDCGRCGGSGYAVPDHCCGCGGSPYCVQCSKCGKCGGDCTCPLTVERADGTTFTV